MAITEQINQTGADRGCPVTHAAEIDRLLARCQSLRGGDTEAALLLAEEALALAESCGDVGRAASCLFESGVCRSRLARYDTAQERLSRSLDLGRSVNGPAFEALCLKELGLISFSRAEFPTAFEFWMQALYLYREIGDKSGVSNLLDNVGCVYLELGDNAAALEYLLASLRLDEERGDDHGVCHSLYNIANVYVNLGEFESAAVFLRRSLASSRQTVNSEVESGTLWLMGDMSVRRGRHAEALATSWEALALARALTGTHPYLEIYALTLHGQAMQGLGRWSEAAECFDQALDHIRRGGDRRQESVLLRSLAAARGGQGRRAEARRHLEAALAVAETAGVKQDICEAHLGLAGSFKEDGDFRRALLHTEAHHTVEREVLSDAADKRAQALTIQMQVEAAQKETELHRLRSVELTRLNAELAEADAQKSALIARLQAQTELLQAQAEELQAQAGELERQAAHDALTGLLNRRSLEERLSEAHAQARRHGSPLVVAMADIDCFKRINDGFGHQTGDAVLREVAALLQRNCRAGDLAARYGGEEFALVMPQTDEAQGHVTCERLRHAVETHSWHALRPGLAVTLSIGLAQDAAAPHHERLLALADARLYEAKAQGRNRVYSAPPRP